MSRLFMRGLNATIFFLFLALIGSGYSQNKPRTSAFYSVPESLRSRLQERINSFIDAYRTEQWGKVYDLLTDNFNVGTKEEFVKSRLENPPQPIDVLLDFIPTHVTYRQGFDEWEINGCSKWQKEGQLSAAIYAYRHGDDWRFSTIALDLVVKHFKRGVSANIHDTVPCKASNNSLNRSAN